MNPSFSGIPIVTEADAASRQFTAMTTPYYSGEEQMLTNAIRDLTRGNIPFALVAVGLGIEVWR